MLGDCFKNPIFRQILIAIGPIVICGCLGNALGYSAILLPQLQNDTNFKNLDDNTQSWIAASYTIPMPFGCIIGGYIMEKMGRRGIHLFTSVPFVAGWFLIAFANSSSIMIVGRFLNGLSDGLLGPATSVFIAETACPKIRGSLMLVAGVTHTIGVFIVHLFGTYLPWRTTAIIFGIIPIIFTIFMLFLPESPTHLAKIGKKDEATKAFNWCRGDSEITKKELQEIIERQNVSSTGSLNIKKIQKSLKQPELWKPLIIISVLFITSQCTGNNAINFYCIDILREMGINGEYFNEFYAMLLLDSIKCTAALCSFFLIKRVSRRTLALSSGYGVSVTLLLVIICLAIETTPKILLVALLSLYMGIFAMGIGPLSWMIMGEVFPQNYRGYGTGFTSFICFLGLFAVVKSYPPMVIYFGNISYIFAIYATLTLIGTVFLTFFLPETKDKPLYVIEDYFKKSKI